MFCCRYPDLRPGLILRKIDDETIRSTKKQKWGAHEVADKLKKLKPPFTLLFEVPRVVHKEYKGHGALGITWKVIEKSGACEPALSSVPCFPGRVLLILREAWTRPCTSIAWCFVCGS